jgi:hypothetical protein
MVEEYATQETSFAYCLLHAGFHFSSEDGGDMFL